MKLLCEHDFDATPDEVRALFRSDAFEQELHAISGVRRDLLEQRSEGDVEIRRLRCTSNRELPAVMSSATGMKHLAYDQVSRTNLKTGELQWSIEFPVMKDRIKAGGTTRIQPHGKGCRRTIDGEIAISIPLIGKKMEELAVNSIRSSYDQAAQVARRMLAAQKG